MLYVYGCRSPNVHKIHITLAELELPFDYQMVDVFKGEQYTEDFLRLTPNNKVPVLVDDDPIGGGAPLKIWESGAIMIYLADKTGKLLPKDATGRYTTLQWLMFQMASIGPMFGQHTHFRVFAPEPEHEYSRQRYASETQRIYGVMEARLSESEYLGSAAYSIADIAAWPWIKNWEMRGIDLKKFPQIARWIDAIAARPAVIKGMADIALKGAPKSWPEFKQTNPDDYDRFLGRGKFSRV